MPEPGERVEDELLIRADKNPNTAGARAAFGFADELTAFDKPADLVLIWGEGFDFARIPPQAKIIFLNSYLAARERARRRFLPISIQTERRGHYTNFQGTVSAFEPCFPKKASVADARSCSLRWRFARRRRHDPGPHSSTWCTSAMR